MSYIKRRRAMSTVSYTRNDEFKFADTAVSDKLTQLANLGPSWQYAHGWANGWSSEAPNLLRILDQGSTATTRIGDVIESASLDINLVLTANSVKDSVANMGGEASTTTNVILKDAYQFLRTTYRVLLILDTQSNSSMTELNLNQVLGITNSSTNTTTASTNDDHDLSKIPSVLAHPEVQNLGRFKILKDLTVNLDSINPQQFLNISHYCGRVRYNGPSKNALTDKGYYLCFATSSFLTPEVARDADPLPSPNVFSTAPPTYVSRLKFTG